MLCPPLLAHCSIVPSPLPPRTWQKSAVSPCAPPSPMCYSGSLCLQSLRVRKNCCVPDCPSVSPIAPPGLGTRPPKMLCPRQPAMLCPRCPQMLCPRGPQMLCPRGPPDAVSPRPTRCCVPAAHQMLCPRGPRGHADWEFSDGGLRVSDRSGTVAPRSLG
jgi:hypothetical protein